MAAIDKLKQLVDSKGTFSKAELYPFIAQINNEQRHAKKHVSVENIKKYDVIFIETLGSVHFMLVYKIKDNFVYGPIFSSQNKSYVLHEVEKDRRFKGSFVTKTIFSVDLEISKQCFVQVYENRQEANLIFRKLKNFYKDAFCL